MRFSSIQVVSGAALAVLGALMLGGCTTVTETGRSQLNLVSADEEMKLGVTEFQQTKQKTPIRHDAQANALVQRAGQRIAAVANLPNAQ
jgi:predicted Zn-dependent protease